MAHDRWATLGRVDLVSFGKDLVTDRLERLGCTVVRPTNPVDGKLEVGTATGRSVEVFVATQRVGGYAFWTKRRPHPARHRLAVLVLLNQGPEPALYVVPSEDWLEPAPPLTDRDYEGRASEPEYGIEIGRSSLPRLRRYAWTETAAKEYFG
jgi:hypothetical protein